MTEYKRTSIDKRPFPSSYQSYASQPWQASVAAVAAASTHNVHGEVTHIINDLFNQNQTSNPTCLNTSASGFYLNSSQSANAFNLASLASHRKRDSVRSSINIMSDRSHLGKQDKEGILLYCGELNRQVESKNTELMKSLKECSGYKALVEQKIQESAREGGNVLTCIVEQLQKERSELKNELIELGGNESFLRSEVSRLEQIVNEQQKVLHECGRSVEEQNKEILIQSSNLQLSEERINRLMSEMSSMQDIFNTKEKLQAQLESRIEVLQQENQSFMQKFKSMEKHKQQWQNELNSERVKLKTNSDQMHFEIIQSIFRTIAQFIGDFQRVAQLDSTNGGESTMSAPVLTQLIRQFDFQMLEDTEASLQFLHNWIGGIFEQAEHLTNLVIKLNGELITSKGRISNLEGDLKESVLICQLLKEKKMKIGHELETVKRHFESDQQILYENAVHEKNLLENQQQSRSHLQMLSEQLLNMQQETDCLKDEVITNLKLKSAKQKSERLLRQELASMQSQNSREKTSKLVYQNLLFKLCHLIPEVELETLIKELISNSEQLIAASFEEESQERIVEEFSEGKKKDIMEGNVSNSTIIQKAKLHSYHESNLKLASAKTKKLRQRETAILSEIDRIQTSQMNKNYKVNKLESEFFKMRSQLKYELKKNEAIKASKTNLLTDRILDSDHAFHIEQSRLNKENQNILLQQDSNSIFQPSDNNTNNKMSVIGLQNLVKQQRSITTTQSKEKYINSLLSSNSSIQKNSSVSSLRNSSSTVSVGNSVNQPTIKRSSSILRTSNSYIGENKNASTVDNNLFLRLKLEDKLNNSKRNHTYV